MAAPAPQPAASAPSVPEPAPAPQSGGAPSPHPCDALDVVYGPSSEKKVSDANILVVGAGGVGCELLKNLASVGFTKITVIDLDTIDFSNLNRQFLFRRHHVGKSKAEEAAASVHAMFPNTKIHPLMANVKEPRFNVAFYSEFTLVCNALDNLEARRHVNRMCLAAKVPLIESGSTGYNGQCVVIGDGVECYDCIPRDPPKSHAVCSIRSTPDQPVHCIVWAKALFELIFGEPDEGNVLRDLDGVPSGDAQPGNGNAENGTEATAGTNGTDKPPTDDAAAKKDNEEEKEKEETDAAQQPRKTPKRVRFLDSDTPATFSKRVCERVFFDEIEEQAAMKDRWTTRDPPTPIDANALADKHGALAMSDVNVLAQELWSEEYCARVMRAVLEHLVTKRKDQVGSMQFDKDDDDALAFVAAAANLRAKAYGVKLSSPFATKGIAGNIVHAIATTNAMIGGLIVLEALKITTAAGKLDGCVSTFVTSAPSGNRVIRLLTAERLRPPNKTCFVCRKGQLVLSVDVDKMLLRDLVGAVAQKRLGVVHPTLNVTTGNYNNTVYECGVGLEPDELEEYDANLKKTLRAARIEDGSQIMLEDLEQRFSVIVHIRHVAGMADAENGDTFSLSGNVDREKTDDKGGEPSSANGSSSTDADGVVDVDDEAEVVVTDEPAAPPKDTKPAAPAVEAVAPEVVQKKAEVAEVGSKRDAVEVTDVDGEDGPEAKRQRAS